MWTRVIEMVRRQPLALAALFIALGGTSYAAVGGGGPGGAGDMRADQVRTASRAIHGCVGNNTGRLRVVSGPARCGTLETHITFSRTGPAGPRGLRGVRGPSGAPGVAQPPVRPALRPGWIPF